LHQSGLFAALNDIGAQLECVLTSAKQGNLLREGRRVVLVGRPNVGKSSLINRLAGEEVSIVTEIPGTTRDAIRQEISLEGVPLQFIDTAGLRETHDPVEKIGIAHTRVAIENADLVLLLIDARSGVTPEDRTILDAFPPGLPVIQVFNKIDILNEYPRISFSANVQEVYLSAKTGAGIELLRQVMLEVFGWRPSISGEGLFMARQRHLQALSEARTHLQAAAVMVGCELQLELLAEELRLAQHSLSSITGEFAADALLGEIFSRFCIGK
jgi:tRNA modification GTPase